jgi:hypothetical protein
MLMCPEQRILKVMATRTFYRITLIIYMLQVSAIHAQWLLMCFVLVAIPRSLFHAELRNPLDLLDVASCVGECASRYVKKSNL